MSNQTRQLLKNSLLGLCSVSLGGLFYFGFPPNSLILLTGLVWFLFITVLLQICESRFLLFINGSLFGLGLYGIGLHWLYQMSAYLPNDSSHTLFSINTAIILIQSLITGIFLLPLYFFRQSTHSLLLALPFLWILQDAFRSWVLSGFPIYQLSHIALDTPLQAWFSVGGERLVSINNADMACD